MFHLSGKRMIPREGFTPSMPEFQFDMGRCRSIDVKGTATTAAHPAAELGSAIPSSPSGREPLEKASTGSEEQLKAVLDVIEDGLVLLDATGRIVFVNKKTRDISGHSQDEMSGKPLDALSMLPPQAMPRLFSLLSSVLCGQPVQPFTLDTLARSGKVEPTKSPPSS